MPALQPWWCSAIALWNRLGPRQELRRLKKTGMCMNSSIQEQQNSGIVSHKNYERNGG